MRRLKFCLVTTFYPPHNFGGDGVFVYRLANALASHGHEVQVVYNRDAFESLSRHAATTPYPNHPNITLHPLSSRLGRMELLLSHQAGAPVTNSAMLRALLDDSGFDVIHFHNISLMGGPGVLEYGRAIKLCTMHDYWFVCAMHVLWRFEREACTRRTCLACTLAGRRPPQLWRYTGAIQRAVHHVDAFIAVSDFARRAAIANGFPAPIHHIPYFLPRLEVQPTAEAGAGYRHPRPYFLYAGRLEKLKGIHDLVAKFRSYRNADLVIVGNGSLEAELREAARDLPHIHFLGWIGHQNLRGLYREAIAAIVPSLCYETFGLVTIEAFAARTPAIVRNIGALPEAVQGGGGLTYRTDDELYAALETLRTQPERRAEMGERGHQRYLTQHTEARHMALYYGLINPLLTQRGQAPVMEAVQPDIESA